ncbi:MAG: phytoene desaturase family protein [Promethearchaeota archaeon]
MKVSIIGSGLAGLTAAAYLAREGHQVTVYEQFSEIGGVTATMSQDGFSWDLGPLLIEGIGPHEMIGKVLIELGLADKIQLIFEDRGQVFPDFEFWSPDKYEGPYWRREMLKQLFPSEKEGLDQYYKFYDRIMKLMAMGSRLEWEKGLKTLLLKFRMLSSFIRVKKKVNWNAKQIMDYFFKEPKIKAIYTSILADFVIKPSEFIGLGIPAVNVEKAFDKRIPVKIKGGKTPMYHYIKGGCGQLVKILADFIQANGGVIQTNMLVKKIVIENKKVSGVKLENGEFKAADTVLASGGAQDICFDLVGREHLPPDLIEKVEKLVHMESVLMVHVGIDFDPSPYQRKALCYYYGTYDIEGGVDHCRSGDFHEGKEGFLLYIPSMHSPEMAPKGKNAVTVYTIAPHQLSKGTWIERREELADKILIEAEKIIPDLRKRALVKIILTPDDFKKRINVKRHSFGGLAPIMGQQGIPHRTTVRGLWFIGAQSESSGGLAGVVSGARKTIKMVLKEN